MMKVVNDCMIHEKMVNIKQEFVKENLKVTRLSWKEKPSSYEFEKNKKVK